MPVIRTLKPFGKKYRSHVSWSHRPRGTLLIFVHGFLGNALSTWQFFDQFMEQTGLDDCDIVFWGHSAGRRNVAAPVAQLFELVNSFWNSPQKAPSFPSGRDDKFRFDRIVFCGHSMGCVVIRQALLSAFEEDLPWSKCSEMVLFAPAHRGMSDFLLLSERYFFISPAMAQRTTQSRLIIKYICPAIDQLRPNSQFLQTLEGRTRDALAKGAGNVARARLVIHGDLDRIVDWEVSFVSDPQSVVIEEKTHVTVCKPFPHAYEEPYTYMREKVLCA